MHHDQLERWQHSHSFGQDRKRPGENRTLLVIGLTGVTMLVEVVAGVLFGSMALLADGLHMASHTIALGINVFAYVYARRHAHDERFCFGTGKVNTLGGFTGAVLLAGFALIMAWESVERFFSPVDIAFDQAISVAVLGLLVNGASVLLLGVDHHDHEPHDHEDHEDHEERDGGHHHHHHDHNLVSAYLHVLADALTSLFAIFALLLAKYFGLLWADPAMGIVGALLVARWSLGLLRDTSRILLDRQAPEATRQAMQTAIEDDGDSRVADLHVWGIGPGLYSAVVSIVAHDPQPPEHYKRRVPDGLGIAHLSVEVHECDEAEIGSTRDPAPTGTRAPRQRRQAFQS